MKTKLLMLSGILIAISSAFVVAQPPVLTITWKQPANQVQAPLEATTDDVSALLSSLQGIPAEESAYLEDDKKVYTSRPNDFQEKTSRKKIVDNVEYMFDQRVSKVLFAKKVKEAGEQTGWSTDLWVLNTLSGQETKVSDSVSFAAFSSSGKFIAVENPTTGGIELYSGDGVFLKKIGAYGAFPLFSTDGKQVAYYKFASTSFTKGLPYDPLGIAIHNLETGEEVLVTSNNEGGKPLAFSTDSKKLYFNSIKASAHSLGVVNLASHEVKQLSGDYDWRYFSVKKNVLVSSNEKAMISVSESGIGMIMFNDKGEVSSVKILADGTNPRWFKQDEIIAYRAQGVSGKYWEFVSVK